MGDTLRQTLPARQLRGSIGRGARVGKFAYQKGIDKAFFVAPWSLGCHAAFCHSSAGKHLYFKDITLLQEGVDYFQDNEVGKSQLFRYLRTRSLEERIDHFDPFLDQNGGTATDHATAPVPTRMPTAAEATKNDGVNMRKRKTSTTHYVHTVSTLRAPTNDANGHKKACYTPNPASNLLTGMVPSPTALIPTTTTTTDATTVTTRTKMSVYFHPACSGHDIPKHDEHYSRVDGILATLQKKWPRDLTFRESKMVTEDQILAFHTPALLDRFLKLSDKALESYERNNKNKKSKKNKNVELLEIDGDTKVMWRTKEAVLHSAGSVISALDHMYAVPTDVNKIDTAFCCVRPPGHHAERDKSGGFCFINNVAIGAKHAQRTHGVERVAILDYDVHHGNGTEEGFTHDSTVFYGSTHERHNFPRTGHDPSPFVGDHAENEVDRRIVNRLLTPGPKSRDDFRVKWGEILSEMERFQPQLVIMSSGFDAHKADELAKCELTDEDFAWITSAILASCARVTQALGSEVRYLSVLEGGYDIEAIQRSAVCHVQAMLQGLPTLPRAH